MVGDILRNPKTFLCFLSISKNYVMEFKLKLLLFEKIWFLIGNITMLWLTCSETQGVPCLFLFTYFMEGNGVT